MLARPSAPPDTPLVDVGRPGTAVRDGTSALHEAGLNNFQWPSEITSTAPSATLMAV